MRINDVKVGETYAAALVFGEPEPVKVLRIDAKPQRIGYRGRTRNVRRPVVEILDGPGKGRERHIEAKQLVGTWAEHGPRIERRKAAKANVEDAGEHLVDALVQAELSEFEPPKWRVSSTLIAGQQYVVVYLSPDQARAVADRIAAGNLAVEEDA